MASIGKYKYYFRKPRSEIVKDVFNWLAVTGMVYIAAGSPYFIYNLLQARRKYKKYPRRKVSTTFDRLRLNGFISIALKSKQIYISLTPKGKKMAGMFQIDKLEIKKPKRWDGKWRLFIFDIAQNKKIIREAIRGKLKQLGFLAFQKSVWIHPFNCKAEIELLKDFFGLTNKEAELIITEDIGQSENWEKVFKLSS